MVLNLKYKEDSRGRVQLWLVERSKLVGTKRVIRQDSSERGPHDVLEDIHFRYNPS